MKRIRRAELRAPGACIASAVVALASAQAATAGVVGAPRAAPPPDFGFDWVTIGHVGNRGATLDEAFDEDTFRRFGEKSSTFAVGRGGVDHEYRLTKTVVTVGQWFEFVQAFTPYAQDVLTAGSVDNSFTDFTGRSIRIKNFPLPPNTDPIYEIVPGANPDAAAIGMSWRFAARYVNWLNNGKALTRDAFAGGAYDEATFDPDTRLGEQLTHDPGAQFWIPTLDEMLKGAYYDPNRYGPGQEGYWRYPDGGNEPLTPGFPGDPGAETRAGLVGISPSEISVGAYPNVLSPMGLLDVSGGGSQLTEEAVVNVFLTRQTVGSAPGDGGHDIGDTLGFLGGDGGNTGLRIASVVPAPGSSLALILTAAFGARRRRGPLEKRSHHQ